MVILKDIQNKTNETILDFETLIVTPKFILQREKPFLSVNDLKNFIWEKKEETIEGRWEEYKSRIPREYFFLLIFRNIMNLFLNKKVY